MKKLALLLTVLSLASVSFGQTSTVRRANAASTDNTILKHDGTGGKTVQDTGIVVDDSNNITGVAGLTLTGSLVSDLDTGLTAGTTQTQVGGLALTAQINDVTTVANANDTVVLAGFSAGSLQIVYNNGANTMQVFPASGDDLGAGTDTATTVLPGGVLVARGISASAANTDVSIPEAVIQKHAVSHTLSAEECFGSVYYITAASVTLTLPAAVDGMSITVICTTANVGIVDSNASDLIILDGTALDDGDSIDSPGAAGDVVVLTYYDATGWFASSNTWVDGGAS
jgi:hypothetical protein